MEKFILIEKKGDPVPLFHETDPRIRLIRNDKTKKNHKYHILSKIIKKNLVIEVDEPITFINISLDLQHTKQFSQKLVEFTTLGKL